MRERGRRGHSELRILDSLGCFHERHDGCRRVVSARHKRRGRDLGLLRVLALQNSAEKRAEKARLGLAHSGHVQRTSLVLHLSLPAASSTHWLARVPARLWPSLWLAMTSGGHSELRRRLPTASMASSCLPFGGACSWVKSSLQTFKQPTSRLIWLFCPFVLEMRARTACDGRK